MFAVIGTDGTREVVWGLGESEASCLADAAMQNDGEDVGELRLVAVSDRQAEHIRAGVVAVADLGDAIEAEQRQYERALATLRKWGP